METVARRKVIGFFVLATIAQAGLTATLDVDRIDDDATQTACTPAPIDCTLRGAVIFAELNPGADEIRLPEDTITLDDPGNLPLTVTTDIAIIGAGRSLSVISPDAMFQGNAFSVEDGGALTLENATISGFTGATFGGAVVVDGDAQSSLTLDNMRLADNLASVGGAIWLGGSGTSPRARLEILNSQIEGNRADAGSVFFLTPQCIGGALYLQDRAAISDSTLADNATTTLYGGGICLISGALTLSKSTLRGNQVPGSNRGGGIDATNSEVVINDSMLGANRSQAGVASVLYAEGGSVDVQRTQIRNNAARGFDLELQAGTEASLTDVTLTNDDIRLAGSNLTLTRTTLLGPAKGLSASDASVLVGDELEVLDQAFAVGGGLRASDTQVRLSNCLFADNEAVMGLGNAGLGGAISLEDSVLEMDACTLSNNVAAVAGGAINLESTALASISNSTFSSNTANAAEALQVISGTDSTLTHNTFADSNGNSQIRFITAGVTLSNNAIDGFCQLSPGSTNVSLGGNVSTSESCQLDAMEDHFVPSLALSSLADFGGPTPTHLPSAGSPLLGAAMGDCAAVDQRGVARAQPCDAGSVELTDGDAGIFLNGFETLQLKRR
ncbi:MAG: right-handed parallel beta-helix repeat-containing protein [Pseudomonadota bacterium]